jgi:hypothetical protein
MELWSELLRDDPVRLKMELRKAGTRLDHLARDIQDVPELEERTAGMSRDEKQRLALEYFGDHGNRQPVHRREWVRATSGSRSSSRSRTAMFTTPDFGQLPPLSSLPAEAVPPAAPEPARRGRGRGGTDYAGQGVERVVRLAHEAERDGKQLGRTLRDRLAKEAKVTEHEVGLIFACMKSGRLGPGNRRGWLTIRGELTPTPPTINLHELKTSS